MDSMIQILEGIDTDSPPCACKRNLAGATTTMDEWATASVALVETAQPASPLLAAFLMLAGGFALDKVRRKR